jgi:lysophospholipase L1-like esterase
VNGLAKAKSRVMRKTTTRLALTAAAVALAIGLPPVAAADPGQKTYILALGDSATAGTQAIAPALVPGGSPETEVNRSGEGYADQLVADLQQEGHKVELVNLACFYETTQTMIAGGGLCTYPHGSQLDEAAQFLHAHGKNVLAVVISIGANDMLRPCLFLDAACYHQRLATAEANLAAILSALRAEGGDVPIAMIDYWNPFLAVYLVPGLGEPVARATVAGIVLPLKQMIQTASAPFGVVLVDTLATFQTENFTDTVTLPGVGEVPVNVALICAYSWMCTHGDIHLNAAGYGLISEEVEQALGL